MLDQSRGTGTLFPVFSIRPLIRFVLLLVTGGTLVTALRAELTEEQKKAVFRKSHQPSSGSGQSSSKSSSQKNTKSGSNSGGGSSHITPSSHTKKHSTESAHHGSGKNNHHAHASSPTSSTANEKPVTGHHAPTSGEAASASHPARSGTTHSEEVTRIQSTPPVPPGATEALSLPHGATPSAPITIEKSGVETEQGMEPALTQTSAAPASSGLFGWLFGSSHRSYNYLSSSTRSAIDHAPVRRGRWKYIIVHNSGTREGNARVFDIYHLRVRHMKNGLAYHFVIGDGHGSGDGQIEIGHRWTAQLNGGHVASDYLNDIALGICLVGDFNRDIPTKAQIGALEELIEYLRNRVGKTQGRKAIIYAHKEINPRPTDCPGDRFPYSWLHGKFGNAR